MVREDPVVFAILVLLLYLVAAALAARAAVQGRELGIAREPAFYVAAGAMLAHAAWLLRALGAEGNSALDLADSVSLMGWVVAVTGLGLLTWRGFRAGAAAVLALAGLMSLGTGSGAAFREIAAPGWPIAAHILLAATASGLLAVGALLLMLMVAEDARLRARRLSGWTRWLPPIESLERAAFATIRLGFAALSLALLTGFLFVTDLFAQHLLHKTVLAILAWIIFAVLLIGRARLGWRGRKAARLTLAGFALLVLSYFGTKFVLEILLQRHWG
jgi:ABC-type uncharacterized transport system permease subunit